MTDGPTNRDLAAIGSTLGESNTDLFETTLYALASPQSGTIGTDECIEFVAGQVYDSADEPYTDTERAREYVETFLDVYEIDTISDANDLLGRQSFEEQNYEGQKAFVA